MRGSQRSLDLSTGPLLRALLVELPEGEQRLLLVIHHLVVDGVSWRILLEDLQQFYQSSDSPAVLRTHSYQAWSAHLREVAGKRHDELAFWQTHLDARQPTCLARILMLLWRTATPASWP